MRTLENQIAVITGAGQGIGRGIAQVFAKAGAQVIIATRSKANGEETLEGIKASGHSATLLPCDVSRKDAVDSMVESVEKRFGRVDILVHNAGVFPLATVQDLSDADLEMTLAVNLKAAFWLTKACLPMMRKNRYGRLLFTSSVTGPRVAMPLLAHYAASKAGLNGFIRALSLEVARDGITVNGVEPGYIRTQAMELLASEEDIAAMAECVPLGRIGDPHDIGYAMLYLASREAAYVTGQTIVVDGGSCTPESPVQLFDFYKSQQADRAVE